MHPMGIIYNHGWNHIFTTHFQATYILYTLFPNNDQPMLSRAQKMTQISPLGQSK